MAAARPGQSRCSRFLLLAYIFNFLDRQILGILAGPIMADLKLTDAQFGAIGGLAFALLYSVLGVPLGHACRPHQPQLGHRRRACGVERLHRAVRHRRQLRPAVPLPARRRRRRSRRRRARPMRLIADYFPPQRRARALAIFSLGIPLGLAGGTLDRRLSRLLDRLARGLPGDGRRRAVLLAPIMLLFVRDLPRPKLQAETAEPLLRAFPIIARKPTFWLMAFAASCSSLCRLRPGAVDAVGADPQLRPRPACRPRPFPCLAAADRRHRRRVRRRLAGRPPRHSRPRLVRAAAGHRLADHRADLRGRPDGRPTSGWPGRCCSSPTRSISSGSGRSRPPSSISSRAACGRPLRPASC